MAVKNVLKTLYSPLPILPVSFYPLCSLPNVERRQAKERLWGDNAFRVVSTATFALEGFLREHGHRSSVAQKPIPIRLDWECHPA